MSNNSEYFPQTSFACTQPTIEHSVNENQSSEDSSSEASLQQQESADSSPSSSTFSPQNYETQQNFNFQDVYLMDVEQSSTENVEFNSQDFQNLMQDLESRLTVCTQECNRLNETREHLTTINQSFFQLEPQYQNQSPRTENFHESPIAFSPSNQLFENQQYQCSITPSLNLEISQNFVTNSPGAYQVAYQDQFISNLRIPTPQSSRESTCKSDCMEGAQAELELIDQVLESKWLLSDTLEEAKEFV